MKTPQLSSRIFAFLIACCLFPALTTAQVPRFDSMYVFGDSLADNGNVLIQSRLFRDNPPVPPSRARIDPISKAGFRTATSRSNFCGRASAVTRLAPLAD